MEPFLGQIQLFPYNFAPVRWLQCDGRVLPIQENTALYSLIGANFGGDGQTTFALPKLEGPAPQVGYFIAMEGVYPPRS